VGAAEFSSSHAAPAIAAAAIDDESVDHSGYSQLLPSA
jgi:hypothetical protein